MVAIKVITREGRQSTIEAKTGISVMEALREHNFAELLALCGGCCSCATCHVHIDSSYRDRLAPMSEDENDLLDSSDDRDECSRLSCQLTVTEAIDGITVTIARDD